MLLLCALLVRFWFALVCFDLTCFGFVGRGLGSLLLLLWFYTVILMLGLLVGVTLWNIGLVLLINLFDCYCYGCGEIL